MKKLLTIAALFAATSLSYGQGYISFANASGTRFSTNAPGATAGSGFTTVGPGTANMFYFELFAAPTTQNTISSTSDPTLNGWTAVHAATNQPSGGRLYGNSEDGGNAAQIPGFAAGSSADFAIVGWSSSIGTTWAEAQAWWNNGGANGTGATGYFGINTAVAQDVALANLGGPYNSIFGTVPGLINGWGLSSYSPIPEPSSFALAGLSAAALLIFRRRKA